MAFHVTVVYEIRDQKHPSVINQFAHFRSMMSAFNDKAQALCISARGNSDIISALEEVEKLIHDSGDSDLIDDFEKIMNDKKFS